MKKLNFKDLQVSDKRPYSDDYDPDGQLERNAKKRKKGALSNVSETELDEVLSKAGRRKIAQAMKKNAKRLQKKKELAAKKKANPEKLKKRAEKKAREMVKAKLLKGKNPKDMPAASLEAIEKKLDKMSGKIAKIAKKLLPGLKKAEADRVAAMGNTDES